ncbi:hypothetical protein CCH79_00007141 [Gambusia affinis]|uniref:Uncharacterized protein n=1 Tax=Gambusia affinis TaxID=33528 RepID=A0A315VC59_GAMAF|nr:hypothetical protein CCH79_00007141 [Gambusia affinis]
MLLPGNSSHIEDDRKQLQDYPEDGLWAHSSRPISLQQRWPEQEERRGMGTTEATLRMEHMEVKDEWQDEDFPRPLPEYEDMDPSCGLTDNRVCKYRTITG